MFDNIPIDVLKIILRYYEEIHYCITCYKNQKERYFMSCDKCLSKQIRRNRKPKQWLIIHSYDTKSIDA